MSQESEFDSAALERLSALADGELDGAATAQACAQWRESESVRVSWHAYHVIGDVLRSDDLANDARRDFAFLASLRARLKDEPVVLAPQGVEPALEESTVATNQRSRNRRSWMVPSAVAAGLVAVAGVMTLSRGPATSPEATVASEVARDTAASQGATSASLVDAPTSVVEQRALIANGDLIRDARLDRYLAAHKQFAGSSALGVPSGFLRNATAVETDR